MVNFFRGKRKIANCDVIGYKSNVKIGFDRRLFYRRDNMEYGVFGREKNIIIVLIVGTSLGNTLKCIKVIILNRFTNEFFWVGYVI